MFKKAISLIIALSFVSFLVASLPGCGGGSAGSSALSSLPPASGVVTAAFYVDSAAGLDTNAGTQAAPFKTITKAINAASAVAATSNADIYAASGVYNTTTGEVFPLMPTTGENLIGPTTGTANIDGSGSYTVSGGEFVTSGAGSITTTIAFAPHVTGSVSGITANGNAPTVIVADNATVTLSNNAFTFSTTGSAYTMWIVNGSTATVTSNTLSGWVAIDTADATTKVIARNNHFDGSFTICTADYTQTASQLDLGTAVSPGNNTILRSGGGGGSAVNNWDQTATDAGVTAVGNTWTPNVQGADANGHYAAQLIPGPTITDVNYSVNPTAGIQF